MPRLKRQINTQQTMKKITPAIAVASLLFGSPLFAQNLAVDSIEINTLKAKVYSDGGIWEMETWDDSTYKPLLFADGIWLGGLDTNSNTLYQSAQTYRQSGLDFSPGPISSNPAASTNYDKVYKVNLKTLTDFKNKMIVGIPAEIAHWPAHGDTNQGEAYYLAPFVDVNQDGHYVPADGDYPKIKGDEAIYTIFNDKNGRSSGMGLEVHCMVYGYKTGGIEDSILFKEYKIINRSAIHYLNSYFSIFADFDLGNHQDDLIGTNVGENSIFTYNGDNDDEGPKGFGTRLATCGIRMLQGPPADYFDGIDNDKDGCIDGIRAANGNCIPENPATGVREKILLSGSMYYNNVFGPQGNPSTPMEYYNYMRSAWSNGNNLIIENPSGFLNVGNGDGYVASNTGTPTGFAYPGNSFDSSGAYNPSTPVNWFEAPNNAADKRMLANAGPFTISAGQEFNVTYAITWSRKQDTAQGYNVINNKLAYLDTVYKNPPPRYVSLPTYKPNSNFRIAYSQYDKSWWVLNEDKAKLNFRLHSTSGQLVDSFYVTANGNHHVDMSRLSSGIYLLVETKSGSSHKIIK